MNRGKPKARPLLRALFLACLSQGISQAQASPDAAGRPLEIAGVFTDHMVLQRRMKVPVWGWAEPGEAVSVSLENQTKTTTAGPQGKWRIDLEPMESCAPRKMIVKGKTASLEIDDILLGEVWLCSGQSNMEWYLSNSKDAAKELATANLPEIRLFNLARDGGSTRTIGAPAERLPDYAPALKLEKDRWQICSPETAGDRFSAVAFFFARQLQADLKVPVGLISNPVGGSSIESWISRAGYEADPEFKVVPQFYDKQIAYAKTPAGKEEIVRRSAEYEAQQVELKAKKQWPLWPTHFPEPGERDSFTSVWFNTRVNPLIPFAIKGVLWYQGEANGYWEGAGNENYPYAYRGLLPLLINDWRSHWAQGDFPFLYVQLPNWAKPSADPASGGGWSLVREAQLMTLKLPKTGMAVAIDVGDTEAIHPLDKAPVGERLSLAARAIAYDEKIVYSGPIYRSLKIEGPAIRLAFDHIGGGLRAKGGGGLKQFAIAGADQKFVPATAVIEGDSVVVSAPEISAPTAVRYAWQTNPEGCNLTNAENLPASPFRTDEDVVPAGAFYQKKLGDAPSLQPR